MGHIWKIREKTDRALCLDECEGKRDGRCFESEISNGDSRFMLGKGGKRKFDEHEDGLEGKIVSPCDGPSKVSYTLQRQTIFNISLMKLYNHRPLTEPSLQKTVLINNMLRRIQEELKQEGSLRPMFTPSSQPTTEPSDSYREAPPAFSHLAPPSSHPCDLGSTTPLEACLTPASLLEDDDDTFCTSQAMQPTAPTKLSPPTLSPEKDSFSSALDEIEELCPTSTSTEAAAAAMDSVKGTSSEAGAQKPDGPQESRADDSKLMDSLPGNFEITTSTGFLTDLTLDDILFADIDTSMYDFDPCTSSSGTASKMAPVSADDLLKTLAPYSSQPVAPSQPFKMDLTELDHIMEVLVGS
ncbi:PREDICTED: SERTA domain-containing protein 2 isoform X2 [Rhinopithecus bieti]|uniref:SERTA domain containing 2 n=2 Tax=Rhinopithecus bieti TaxID=61621 RepID=A0A2K6M1N9_RHIBE|nr:PREDICTED: SERTA domain-containing protein 2 isoform X2 [Rhinopithecus bieti]XP_033095124.1 SERTA domain-containing protein 2 isoform X1 [Trachypithecus francoisi]